MKSENPTPRASPLAALPNLVPPEICRQFLAETYRDARDFLEPLVMHMLGGMSSYEMFLARWEDYDRGVFCISEVGHSIHVHRPADAWMDFCRQPDGKGSICRITQRQWKAYMKRLLAGKFHLTALGNCYPYYDRVYRKGSEIWSEPEASNARNAAILFDCLVPEVVLSTRFEEFVAEFKKITT